MLDGDSLLNGTLRFGPLGQKTVYALEGRVNKKGHAYLHGIKHISSGLPISSTKKDLITALLWPNNTLTMHRLIAGRLKAACKV